MSGAPAEGVGRGSGAAPGGEASLYEFGPFVLRVSDRTLFRGEERVRITPRVLDLLTCLVEEAGRVVAKERLLERVWEGTFVEEGNVNRTVSTLRRLLEETEERPFIETVPRLGYRFVAPVRRRSEPAAQAAATAEAPVPLPVLVVAPAVPDDPPVPAPARPDERRRRSRWPGVAVAAVAVLALAGAGVGWWRARERKVPRSLAVLPFGFSAGAANGETLGVALADAVIARLSRTDRLDVRSTTAVLPFRDRKTDPLEAGRRLDVDAVLDAQVSQEKGRTRVSMRLLRRRDGTVLHAEAFETGATGLFVLQDRVAERVAAALLVPLAPASGRREAARLAATELFVRARQLATERPAVPAGPDEAVSLFRRAIEADPDFALAYVGLADALLALSVDNAPEAEEAARRALAIDDRLGAAHATLGSIRMVRDWDWAAAEAELAKALEFEPSYAPAWQGRGTLLALTGRPGDARAAAARAVELDPTSPAALCDAGRVALHRGALDEARALLARARSAAPGSSLPAALETAVTEASDAAEARRRAGELLARAGVGPATPVAPRAGARDEAALARALALSGHGAAALAWLSEAVRERRPSAPFAAVDPAWKAFRGDPRFVAAIRAMGLPVPRG